MQGFWVKFIRNRGPRIGEDGRIIRLEHIPYRKCRFEYPDDRHDLPQNVYVGDWPFPDPDRLAKYPVFNPADPFRHPVSVGYFNIYSFCRDFVSTPRFLGAFPWLELAGTIAPLLAAYNANASALSLHIESPQPIGTRQRTGSGKYASVRGCLIRPECSRNSRMKPWRSSLQE
jgi:hypothetical protein